MAPQYEGEKDGKFEDKMGCKWSSLNAPSTQSPYLIQFWSYKNSLFPLLALWGNRNWPTSMKKNKRAMALYWARN